MNDTGTNALRAPIEALIAYHEKYAKDHVSSQWIYGENMMVVQAYKKVLAMLAALAARSEAQSAEEVRRMITLTDANYGNPLYVVAQDITGLTIVAETTYREGMIPGGTFRRTIVYTVGGNQFQVRETPEEVRAALSRPAAGEPRPAHVDSLTQVVRYLLSDVKLMLSKNGKMTDGFKRTMGWDISRAKTALEWAERSAAPESSVRCSDKAAKDPKFWEAMDELVRAAYKLCGGKP